jgi:hypothetical protein
MRGGGLASVASRARGLTTVRRAKLRELGTVPDLQEESQGSWTGEIATSPRLSLAVGWSRDAAGE